MSLKNRLQYKIRYLKYALRSLGLPSWMTGMVARVTLSIFVVAIGMAYVVQVSEWSTKGYVVHELEQQMAIEETQIAKIESETASYTSMASIQRRLKEVIMLEASSVQKVVLENPVAQR